MAAKTRYMSIGDMESICRIAGISPDRIRRRAGLGSSMEELRRTGVTATEYFALCTALEEESDRADLPVFLGQTSARVPRQSEMLAYTCSPDVETGIRRLALFKPLLAPVSLGVERRPTGLHSGEVSADAVADRQRVSKRSLQRKLSEEGVSYQAVLDGIRSELATRYLRRGDLSVGEISYLLGFRDPNSFYRAFQKWTRTTPARARLDLMEAPG